MRNRLALAIATAGCSSSLGGGDPTAGKTDVMPNGQAEPEMTGPGTGPGTGTAS